VSQAFHYLVDVGALSWKTAQKFQPSSGRRGGHGYKEEKMTPKFLGALLVIVGVYSMAEGASARLSQADKAKIARQVKSIFENKCAKCHGPEGVRTWTKPNGDFDYVLDLKKLGSNPEMIVPGDPNESKLFQAVDDEIMPNEEEGEDPLPANEKEIIRRWILVGAPTEEGISPTLR
jgi:mono/diheme cytochrome c family protein